MPADARICSTGGPPICVGTEKNVWEKCGKLHYGPGFWFFFRRAAVWFNSTQQPTTIPLSGRPAADLMR